MGLGFDKKWTEKTDGAERTNSYSISSTLACDVTQLELVGAPASISVFGGAAQDFSSYNEMAGRRDEDLGTSLVEVCRLHGQLLNGGHFRFHH